MEKLTTTRVSHHLGHKSLRLVADANADFSEVAHASVCFANAAGGALLFGNKDDVDAPPAHHRVEPALVARIRERVGELTVNVQVAPELKRHDNGGEYFAPTVPRATGIALMSDGRYLLRVGNTCRSMVCDEVMRLANERPEAPWKEMTSLRIPRAADRLNAISLGDPEAISLAEPEPLCFVDPARGTTLRRIPQVRPMPCGGAPPARDGAQAIERTRRAARAHVRVEAATARRSVLGRA